MANKIKNIKNYQKCITMANKTKNIKNYQKYHLPISLYKKDTSRTLEGFYQCPGSKKIM